MSSGDPGPALFGRLLPEPATVTAAEAVRSVNPTADARGARPHVALNMVCTADGRATPAGRTSRISNRADRELFHQLRTRFDAVMIGAGTARIEHYGRIARDPDLRAQRERNGLSADPWRSSSVVGSTFPRRRSAAGRPGVHGSILTASERKIDGAAGPLHYLRANGEALDLARMLAELRAGLGVSAPRPEPLEARRRIPRPSRAWRSALAGGLLCEHGQTVTQCVDTLLDLAMCHHEARRSPIGRGRIVSAGCRLSSGSLRSPGRSHSPLPTTMASSP